MSSRHRMRHKVKGRLEINVLVVPIYSVHILVSPRVPSWPRLPYGSLVLPPLEEDKLLSLVRRRVLHGWLRCRRHKHCQHLIRRHSFDSDKRIPEQRETLLPQRQGLRVLFWWWG